MLQNLVCVNRDKRKGLLLAFPGRRGHGFAGLMLPSAKKEIDYGFRKGHMSQHILLQRYGVYPVRGASVIRCDPSWVHGRDHNPDVTILGNKTVLLLGVGSLGSGVAELLAKMGIGKLVLVDPEALSTENTSRHTLGVRSMSRMKAAEQANILSKRFPHLQFESHCERWELCYKKDRSIFTSADLIISTIGSWSAESSLSALTYNSKEFPPVIFGWLEEQAAAAHAVAFFGEEGCLRCITDDMGRPRVPVTKWPGVGTQKMVPMCGGVFQPYGANELSYSQTLVADLVADILLGRVTSSAHQVWIGQKKLLERENGEWHPDWIVRHGSPENGGRMMIVPFKNDVSCPICGRPL
ncbi:ThiF family adenylyltransferase [Geoalkalibacter ferrihydriticus]|nr:ThiF family adenylyltransferase [Geoalkalibacter ferrihydriticus]